VIARFLLSAPSLGKISISFFIMVMQKQTSAHTPRGKESAKTSSRLTAESCEQEEVEVFLLLDFRAPVPGARQTSVDARAAVITVTVEGVLEEIAQDFELRRLQ
jgi:hypothetical protein